MCFSNCAFRLQENVCVYFCPKLYQCPYFIVIFVLLITAILIITVMIINYNVRIIMILLLS